MDMGLPFMAIGISSFGILAYSGIKIQLEWGKYLKLQKTREVCFFFFSFCSDAKDNQSFFDNLVVTDKYLNLYLKYLNLQVFHFNG